MHFDSYSELTLCNFVFMDDLFDMLRVPMRYLGNFCQITLYWIKFICVGLET